VNNNFEFKYLSSHNINQFELHVIIKMNDIQRLTSEVPNEDGLLNDIQSNPSIMTCMKIAKLYPSKSSFADLGRVLYKFNKFDSAQVFLREALGNDQDAKADIEDLRLVLDLVKCNWKLGNIETAKGYCNHGMKALKQSNWKDNDNIKNLLKEFNAFISILEKNEVDVETKKAPVNVEVLVQKGIELMKMEKYKEAVKEFEGAYEILKKSKNGTDKIMVDVAKYKALCIRKVHDKENSQSATKVATHMKSLINSTGFSKLFTVTSSMKEFPTVQASDKRDKVKIEQERAEAVKLLKSFGGKYREFTSLRRWHIVSTNWFEKWKVYMKITKSKNERSVSSASKNYILSSNSHTTGSYPGPITNTTLLYETKGILKDPLMQEYPIKSDMKEKVDFIVVPDKLWLLWESVYGGCDILRLSYPEKDQMGLDLYLQEVSVVLLPQVGEWVPNDIQKIYVSKNITERDFIEKCERIVKELMKSKGEAEFRVWKVKETAEELFKKFSIDSSTQQVIIKGKILNDNELLIENNEKRLILIEFTVSGKGFIAEPLTAKTIQRQRGDFSFARQSFKDILPQNSSMGIAGIENITNSCYMNSGIQCLSYCTELSKYFLLGLHKQDLKSDKKGLAIAYSNIINNLWREPKTIITTRELKGQLAKRVEQFCGFTQEDSGEFVVFLIDGLHEGLNRAHSNAPAPIKEDDEEEQWKQYWERNDSIIMELFLGQMKTQIVCPKCDYTANRFEAFLTLSLPIPSFNYLTIIYVPKELEGTILRKTIKVEGNMNIKSIKDKADIKYLYAIVRNGQILYRLSETTSLLTIAEHTDELYAFEYDYEEEGQPRHLIEIQVSQTDSRLRPRLSTRPIVFCALMNWSLEMFKLRLFKKLLPFFRDKLSPESELELEKGHFQGKVPYQLYIVPGVEGCEFCDNPHIGNCEFCFQGENQITIKDVVQALHNRDNLVLNLTVGDSNNLFKQLIIATPINEEKKKLTIYDCMDAFSKEEQLDKDNMWGCNECKEKVQAIRKLSISKAPPILIVQLNRFLHEDMYSATRKVQSFVDYPIENFSLEKYVSGADKTKAQYNLFGVTNHFGGAGDGHYTAFCKNEIKNMWIEFDDKKLSGVREEDVVSKSGYVLYYRRKDLC